MSEQMCQCGKNHNVEDHLPLNPPYTHDTRDISTIRIYGLTVRQIGLLRDFYMNQTGDTTLTNLGIMTDQNKIVKEK
jgi:hypothetical protein